VILRFAQFRIDTIDRLAILLEQVGEAEMSLVIVRRGRLYRTRMATRSAH
jgi:hypothetical protein